MAGFIESATTLINEIILYFFLANNYEHFFFYFLVNSFPHFYIPVQQSSRLQGQRLLSKFYI